MDKAKPAPDIDHENGQYNLPVDEHGKSATLKNAHPSG
jgi:hypothetical protein